jgi:hypothetical protein
VEQLLKHINYITAITLLFVTLIYATIYVYYNNNYNEKSLIPLVYASPAHTFDTKARGTGTGKPQTLSYTCGSGATLLVLGIVVAGTTARAGGAPTYNGVSMTQVDTVRTAGETNCEMWYLVNPSTGSAYSISVPNTGGKTLYLIASSYIAQSGYTSALDVYTGTAKTSNTANPSLSVTTTVDGDVVVDILGDGYSSKPTANSHVLLYSTDDGSYSDNAQYALQASAGSITLSWTCSADDYCMIVGAFKEVVNVPPTNDALTLDLTGASYKSTKTLLCAKQDYKFVYLCSDANGVTDITYAQIQLDPTGKNVILRATRGSGDTWTFSEQSDPSNYVTLNTGGSTHSTSGNQKTFNFLVTINWNWGDSAETVTVRCYVIDASSASDQDDYTNIFGVEAHLTAYSLAVSDYRCNPSQTLTFSGYWYYNGTNIAPSDSNYAVVVKLSGVQKGSTDTTLVSGAFSINDVTAESTLNSYSYTVEATYMSGAGSFSAVIVDRIRIDTLSAIDTRIDIGTQGTFYATASLEYDSHALGSGDSLTLGGYVFSWVAGNNRFEYSSTQSSVTSITVNSFTSGNEATYGITTGNINSQTVTLVWDRIIVYWEQLDDSRVNIGTNIEGRYKAVLQFDNHALGSGDSLSCSWGNLAWDNANNWFDLIHSESTVTGVTISGWGGNEATYEITAITENITESTYIYDRIEIYEADEPLTIGGSNLNSNFDKQINIIVFMILSTLILVSLVSVKKTKKRLLITLTMFFAIVSMMPINLTFATENKGEHPINSVVRIWYKARYDYDDVVFDNSKGTLYINGTLATWNGTGGYWYRDVTSAQIGVKTYVVDQVSDTEYGLTVIVHTCSYITITWVEVTGYNLNLRVMDWDITDSIANAYVCMNNGIENWKTSDISGWANYTLVSGSVTVKVRYFGFWVNETSLTISSDTTMSLQCKLYDVIVNVRENIRNAKLSNVNVTVYNSTNYKIKSGISDNNGQVSLSNLPNNTLTFTEYGGNSYTLVIGNTTEPIGYDDYVFTVICNQNYVGTTSNYSILVWVGGIVIPLEGSFVTKRLKRKMYKKRKKPK